MPYPPPAQTRNYTINQGGLMRCCIQTIDGAMTHEPQHFQNLKKCFCLFCGSRIHIENAHNHLTFSWAGPRLKAGKREDA